MEITNLMLNDYVMIHCFDGSDIVIKVTEIEGEGGTVYGVSKKGSHWSNIEDVRPIPFTPEILGKNGFVLKSDGWLWCKEEGINEQNYIFIQFRKGCDEIRLVELNFVNKVLAKYEQIHYVHELQHALKLFKIKKEIVL